MSDRQAPKRDEKAGRGRRIGAEKVFRHWLVGLIFESLRLGFLGGPFDQQGFFFEFNFWSSIREFVCIFFVSFHSFLFLILVFLSICAFLKCFFFFVFYTVCIVVTTTANQVEGHYFNLILTSSFCYSLYRDGTAAPPAGGGGRQYHRKKRKKKNATPPKGGNAALLERTLT